MNTFLDFLNENADIIGIITAISVAVAGGLWTIFKYFKTKRESISDLNISPLSGPNAKRLVPLDGYEVFQDIQRSVFKEGVKVELIFSHNGKGTAIITFSRLELVVKKFEPGKKPEYDYKVDGNAIIGAGSPKAHEFRISVNNTKVDRAVWIIDDKLSKFEIAKSNNFFDVDAINAENGNLLTFAPQEEKPEAIRGTILTGEPGLYELQFVYYYIVGNSDKLQKSESFFIYTK